MALSLRIPPDKEEKIRLLAKKTGKTKTSLILEAVDEKFGLSDNHQSRIKKLAGWMSADEAEELRKSVQIFEQLNDGDWE